MKLGATDISKVYLGATEVTKAYLGDTLVHGILLPYDAEVEWLEGTGAQYIDTGLQIQYSNSVAVKQKCRLAFTATNVRQLNGSNGLGFWGITAQGKWESTNGTSNVSAGITWHDVEWNYYKNGGNGYLSLKVDGTVVLSGARKISNTYIYDIFLFAIGGRDHAAAQLFCKEKVGAYQIYFDNVLVRDYIPVRNNGIGYLYDKVSGTLFGNAGTGAFTYGNDVTI